MKVAISFFNDIIGGPREVTRNLLKYIPNIDKSIHYFIFTESDSGLEFLQDETNVTIIILKKFSKYDLLFWEQVLVPFYTFKYKIDVFHGTKNAIPLLGFTKKICTIHDLAYYILPDTFSFMQRVHLKISCVIAKYFSHRVTAVSNNTKKDINAILKIKESSIDVIYNSVDEKFYIKPQDSTLKSVAEKYKLPKKFFLHVGTLQPRKNISTIVDAFVKYKKEDEQDCYLVLAGRKGWYYDDISNYINESGVAEYVIFTGPIENEELVVFYNLAYLFIYASNYDGFGLVPLESMATGTPTISSDISSLPEVIGDAAIGVSPKSAQDIYEGITLLMNNREKYNEFCIKGVEQAKKFSWKRSAIEYVDLYKKIKNE